MIKRFHENYLQLLFVLGFSAFAGGYSAWFTLQSEYFFDSIVAGQWKSNKTSGSSLTQPYERARLALHTQAQLGLGEGLRFVATLDDRGNPFKVNCTYLAKGPAPKARIFTFFATDLKGQRLKGNIGFYETLHSRNIGYTLENHINITLSPELSPGDWIYIPNKGGNDDQPYQLIMNLYDTSIGALSDYTNIELPTIKLVRCP